jgi:xylulose-5-phosphate/fructose-6-phosphate phosphoketolase
VTAERTYDVVLVGIGDYQTNENYQASIILRKLAPSLRFKFININQISQNGLGSPSNPIDKSKEIHNVFEKDIDVIFNFHGYPTAIQQLICGTELASRSQIFGYIEQGGTTTPLNMQMLNKTSRYHIAIASIISASKFNKEIDKYKDVLVDKIYDMMSEQSYNILKYGQDM